MPGLKSAVNTAARPWLHVKAATGFSNLYGVFRVDFTVSETS